MLRFITIAAVTALSLTPAHAKWFGMIYESGVVRQASLSGMGDADPNRQIGITCTTSTGSPIRSYNIGVYLPATGEYSVRQGDSAEAVISMGGEVWTVGMEVSGNDSSGFGANADSNVVLKIVNDLEEAPAEMTIAFTAGPITESISINTDKLEAAATEFLDACVR